MDAKELRASLRKPKVTLPEPKEVIEPITTETQEVRTFTPDVNQKRVFDELMYTDNDIVIKATAGSGKTTTIVNGVKYIPYGKSSVFIAFNKHTVEELEERLPKTVHTSTLHRLGLQAIRTSVKNISGIGDNKQIRFIEKYFERITDKREKWAGIISCDQVMKLVRATMTPRVPDEIMKMAMNYNLAPSQPEITIVCRALKDMDEYNANNRSNLFVDFQDMIELPVKYSNMRMPQYDFVFMDECQDASELDLLFIEKLIKRQSGRLIAVGDPNQSIYGFRGASIKSFEKICARPKAKVLPLDISYRCSAEVVAHAQKVYNDIRPYVNAKKGVVNENLSQFDFYHTIGEGDMILSRNLKPLVHVYFELLKRGMKSMIYGKEVEKHLLDYLERFKDMTVEEMNVKMTDHLVKLTEELNAKGFVNPENVPTYQTLKERIDVIRLLATGFEHVYQVEQRVVEIFDDQTATIKLMTIHKSKGKENDRVFLITHFEGKKLLPSTYAVTPDQKLQEKNLSFVAITRAKREFYEVRIHPDL